MEPVRTCIGCRSRATRSSLMRVVVQDSRVIIDDSGAGPGRGAWLHPRHECYQLALRRRAFGRALRVQGELDTRNVENRLNG